ncbi:hypothetical protein [Microbulbifer sp. TYP-18]|uniref:hypothetical protein n=1 Tax=Microbulbifer sp. TYP-18 TaxID=3230024 RepID=UPI0034C6A06E
MANDTLKKVQITKPCMAAGKPASVGKELALDIGEANQLIGTGRAKAVEVASKGRDRNNKAKPTSTADQAEILSTNNGDQDHGPRL